MNEKPLFKKVASDYMEKVAFMVAPVVRKEDAPEIMTSFSHAAIEKMSAKLAASLASSFRQVQPSRKELSELFSVFIKRRGKKKVRVYPTDSEGIHVLPRSVNRSFLQFTDAFYGTIRFVKDFFPNRNSTERWKRRHVKTIAEWVGGLALLNKNPKAINYFGYQPEEIKDEIMREFKDFLKKYIPEFAANRAVEFSKKYSNHLLDSFLFTMKRAIVLEEESIEAKYQKQLHKRAFFSGGGVANYDLEDDSFKDAITYSFRGSLNLFRKVVASYLDSPDIELVNHGIDHVDRANLERSLMRKFLPYLRQAFIKKKLNFKIPNIF